jgi:hypothetical protein
VNTAPGTFVADPIGAIGQALDAAIAAATDAALIQKLQDAKTALSFHIAQMRSTAGARDQLQKDVDAANAALANGGVANLYANRVIADATAKLKDARGRVDAANAQTDAMKNAMPPPDQTFVTAGAAAGFAAAGLVLGSLLGYFARGMLEASKAKKAAAALKGTEETAALPAETETEDVQETAAPAVAAPPRRKKKRVVRAAAAAEE